MSQNKAARSAWAAAALLLISAGLVAIPPHANIQEPKTPTYAEMVEKAKSGDPTVDFAALRFAFLDAPGGHKEGFFNSRLLNGLAQQKDYDKLLKTANDFLAQDFVDMRSHFAASVAYHGLGREEESQKEAAIGKGLAKSITDSGDGKTQKTAFVVISVSEEYATLEWLGIQPKGQQSLIIGGKDLPPCDMLVCVKNGQTMNIYIDISKFYGKELRKN
jgi:hypothetical protein